eukprot:GFYU01013874.1.p1 GENE.GFYU01013874.1~~GFYU01013874.1.p1  ORF type:complete len:228 (+),score=74.86 GFYU01013874.1:53-685(+)
MSDTQLYSYWRSSCSWRVRIALNFKGVSYEYLPVHLVKDGGEQLKDEYADKNPSKEVPLLVIDGNSITQSTAILEYLEETRPEKNLLPADPAARAKVRSLVQIINAGTQPIQNLKVLKYVGDDKKMEWAKYWIAEGLKAFEKALKDCHGTCCFGDSVTLADVMLPPQLYNARRFSVNLEELPLLVKIEEHLNTMQAFKDAHPDVQPDAQK